MYCVLVVISVLQGIFAPIMVIWSSSDARAQCRNLWKMATSTSSVEPDSSSDGFSIGMNNLRKNISDGNRYLLSKHISIR